MSVDPMGSCSHSKAHLRVGFTFCWHRPLKLATGVTMIVFNQQSKPWKNPMTITYADIKKKREQLDDKRSAHVNRIINGIRQLRNEYFSSLQTPNQLWKDIHGEEHEYVLLQDDQGFEVKPQTIHLNENYEASFVLSTVIDDTPRGGCAINVPIKIFIMDGKITVEVNKPTSRDYQSYIITEVEDGSYFEVCEKIKDSVFVAINDEGLELKSFGSFN